MPLSIVRKLNDTNQSMPLFSFGTVDCPGNVDQSVVGLVEAVLQHYSTTVTRPLATFFHHCTVCRVSLDLLRACIGQSITRSKDCADRDEVPSFVESMIAIHVLQVRRHTAFALSPHLP